MKNIGIVLLDSLPNKILSEAIRLVEDVLSRKIPKIAFYNCTVPPDQLRRQKRADLILSKCLQQHKSEELLIALTGDDIYVEGLNFVFGLADEHLGAAVVSWWRLTEPSEILPIRIAKEIVHETGHLMGVRHCGNKQCVMWFSNTLAETDGKSMTFCSACQVTLNP